MRFSYGRAQFILLAGGIVGFLIFSTTGRATHNESLPFLSILQTAAPFLGAWLVVAFPLGAYKLDSMRAPATVVLRTLFVWGISCALGLVLRSLLLQRPIIPVFALVTFGVVAALLIILRGAFAFVVKRKMLDRA